MKLPFAFSSDGQPSKAADIVLCLFGVFLFFNYLKKNTHTPQKKNPKNFRASLVLQ